MARSTVNITNTYQQIATGVATITVHKSGSGTLYLNETATDVNANNFKPDNSDQYIQDEAKNTWVRSDGLGWVLLVDGATV